MPRRSNTKSHGLSARDYVRLLFGVATTTYHAAPFAIGVQLWGALVGSIPPLITTYFAVATTTALADA